MSQSGHGPARPIFSRPRVRGGRGVALLGFGGISLLMATAYISGPHLGPFAVWPPVARGLYALDMVGGMRMWGFFWLVTGTLLVRAAFSRHQTLGMSAFAFMAATWSLSYAWAFARDLMTVGESSLWLSSAVYASLLIACTGLARMLNSPPLEIEAILKRLKQLEQECPPEITGRRQ